ncbi:uncharacterized protein LOC121369202 [Gigantopelta aegis]|uniref:uncharacterized protein LOC121369202 n=1 Tax=Gigantopelta aegis TaxID=1735272 RepID=UPI001B889915|nr:uncharacterized protein LOC121369202 [Gigantopelta aegis]XP_041350059.1 uncharacterized protein LOC121369202 [Gigantopelta aegis]
MACNSMLLLCVMLMVCITVSLGLEKYPLFPDRSKPPGLNNPQKLWWAKELTPDLHVAGRLSERQMKYTMESGFKSILSLFFYGDNEVGDFGGEKLPITKQQQDIAKSIGINFTFALGPDDDWCSVKAVEKFAQVLSTLEHPVLLHCDRGYTITFVALMHLANLTRHDKNFEPKINSQRFYDICAAMGLNFTQDFMKDVVAEITGEPVVENPTAPDAIPPEWLDYWLGHPVYKNWYSSGQVTPSQIKVLEFIGIKSIINMRAGVKFGDKPTQEEVALLNIKAETGTYGDETHPPRQTVQRLEETRIDPSRPNTYIGESSPVNYEAKNPEEFGDEIGYNEGLEREAFKKSPIKYHHIPWPSHLMKDERAITFFEENLSEIAKIGKHGPVLIQCRTGKRAAYFAVAAAAVQYNKTLDWALTRLRELGFTVSAKKEPFIYQSYVKVLSNHDEL